jgi:hypothetical protein
MRMGNPLMARWRLSADGVRTVAQHVGQVGTCCEPCCHSTGSSTGRSRSSTCSQIIAEIISISLGRTRKIPGNRPGIFLCRLQLFDLMDELNGIAMLNMLLRFH